MAFKSTDYKCHNSLISDCGRYVTSVVLEMQPDYPSLRFIDIREYIKQYFKQGGFVISGESSESRWSQYKFERIVNLNNRIQECNLRLVESHLPELLFLFSQYAEDGISIEELIDIVADSVQLPDSIISPKDFLKVRFYNLFDAVLYGMEANEVWRGYWQLDRCFVIIIDGNLKYYNLYNRPELLKDLFSWLVFVPICARRMGTIKYTLEFKFLK